MMKRYLFSIILGMLSFANTAYTQVEVVFSEASGNANGTVDVDIVVNNFDNVAGIQFSGAWDSLVMRYNSAVSVNEDVPMLNLSNIGGPEGAGLDEGQFSFAYGNPNGGVDLDDGTVLFTLRFDLVGEECESTQIIMTGDPTDISGFDGNFEDISITSVSNDVTINGPDCGGSSGDDLTITVPMVNALQGSTICVPLLTENFANIQAGSGTILWDPAVISYTMIDNINLGGVGSSLNETQTDNGELKFVWSNPTPSTPLTLTDGTPIFEICFEAVGDVGDMSTITLSTQGSLGFEWFDDNDDEVAQTLVNGKVTITENAGPPFVLTVSDVSVNQDASQGCVDISVTNFTNILTTQYVLTWDPSVIGNADPTNFNLAGINDNSFAIDNNSGSATFSWNDNVGVTLGDGTVIYSICFDLVGECMESSTVDIVSQGSTNIEIIDGNTNEITNVQINEGSITITCDECEITSIDRPCAGALNGNVIVDVPDGCSYSWADGSGAEIATTKNLLGVGAGTYILTVSCGGAETCTLEAMVQALPALVITGDVVNAACGSLGSIDVDVSGGSGNYSYNWNPALPNAAFVSSLNPATYNVTVTDTDSNCSGTMTFTVMNGEADLEITNADVTAETCEAGTGSIILSVSGGCLPYSYEWSDTEIGNNPNATGLDAGTYGVTVTDDATPPNMVTASYTIDAVSPLILVGAPTILPETDNMSNGSIAISIDGGTEPYSYNWSGPTANLPNSASITGLSAGLYNVVVTDANDCEILLGPYEVINQVIVQGAPEVDGVSVVNNANGFGVICNGDRNGVISGNIANGTLPMTITLSGGADESMTQTTLGTFSFDGLSADTYTITVSNTEGSVSFEDIEITEPDAITFDIDKGCEEGEQCDGFIDLNLDGGFGVFEIVWSDPDLEGDSVDDLCGGTYTVTATDENGCIMMESITIDPCSIIPTGCYEVRNVITPNGDGMNETFAVTCITDFPASLEVYDRWGALVYNQAEYDGSWAGTNNSGEDLIEGGYMYVIVIDFGQGNRQIMRGSITLLRD